MSEFFESEKPIPPFEASKFLAVQVLLSEEEMQALAESLPQFFIVRVGQLLEKGEAIVSFDHFFKTYKTYIGKLRLGEKVDLTAFRPLFSTAWSVDLTHFSAMVISSQKQIVKVIKPVVQLQAHAMGYSEVDGKFRPLVFGKGSIAWGLQFSYPQLFHEANLAKVHRVDNTFPNTLLYRSLQKWMRYHTVPTPIYKDDLPRVSLPIRLGKQCFSWIDSHPDLIDKNLKIR